MKHFHRPLPRKLGFTLIELLVVIAIIAILAALLLPAIMKGPQKVKINQAKTDLQVLILAVKGYDAEYGHFPVARASEQAVLTTNGDLTLGPGPAGFGPLPNAELVIILRDLDRAPNAGHVRNPHNLSSPIGKMVSGTEPGVSNGDYIYRDPWGKPYIVSVDLNNDHKCRDAFYSLSKVSKDLTKTGGIGLNGLASKDLSGNSDDFEFDGSVMAWSQGPDGSSDPILPADQGANRDNILSWK